MGKRSREKKERRLQGGVEQKRSETETGWEKILKGIIFIGTILILFTPLILRSEFFFPFVGPKSLYFMGLVEIIFFTWLFLIIFSPKYRPRLNLILLALILFLIALILSAVFGTDFSNSFWSKFERMTGVLMMLHLFFFFLVIFSVFKEKEWVQIFAVSIFIGVILSSIALISKNPSMRGGATIGNESFLGTYLLFDLFLALYLIFKTRAGLRIYSSFCFLIMAVWMILGGARAAKLSVLGGLILLLFLYLALVPKKKFLKYLGRTLLILSLIGFLVSVYLVFQPDNIIHQKFIEQASRARLVVWEKAWKGFLERPWLGWGPENFEFVFAKYFNPCMFLRECGGEIWFDRAHNVVFDFLVQTGIIGFLSYLLVFGTVFLILWKRFFKGKIDFLTAGIFSVLLISYFVQNLTVFDMVSSYMIFFLVLGFIASFTLPKEENQIPGKISSPNFLVAFVFLILFIFSFVNFIVKPFKTDYYTIEVIKYQDSAKRLDFYKKALETSPLGKHQIRTFFAEQFENFLQSEAGKKVSQKDLLEELNFLTDELKKSINESPLDFRSYLRLGQLYNTLFTVDQTKIAEAEEIIQKTIELSPTNQQGYWELAQTKLYEGKIEEALSLAEKAVELDKKVPQSHLIVIQIAKFMGDNELVKKKAEEAIEIIPELEPKIKEILGTN